MNELSEQDHWDSVHQRTDDVLTHSERAQSESDGAAHTGFKGAIKKLLGRDMLERMTNYDDYLLHEIIFKTYLPQNKGARLLEVGSAPGLNLVYLDHTYAFDVYGVDYSEVGVKLNRETFAANDINPDNCIHADFFSESFQERYRQLFDVVYSYGFIEHFTDAEDVIAKHVNLLKPGGRLIVSVPNLRGFNRLMLTVFNKENLDIHNLDLMKKSRFRRAFARPDLAPLHCDYYGTFSIYLAFAREGSLLRLPLSALYKVQPLLNLCFRTVLKRRGAESSFFSPHLIYVGTKQ